MTAPEGESDDLLAQVGVEHSGQIVPRRTSRPLAPPPPPPIVLSDNGARGPLSGTTWDGYAIGDLLGVGGMGAVYRAAQLATGRVVAFKVLAEAGAEDPQQRARFANEVMAAARIDSPQVVRIHDSGSYQGRMWVAMEHINGRTLAEELRTRSANGHRFSPFEAVDLLLQAAHGVAAAHALRLVHRDIKPGNLLLTSEGVLKVTDFGLVRVLDGHTLTRTGDVLGTPLYLPPEQGRGLATDARGDVYSLGVVLYELLTMRLPFNGETADALIFQHNYVEPQLPSELNADISLDLQAVCMKCLQKDPAHRFADAAALATDLQRVRAGLAPASAIFPGGKPTTGADEALRQLAGWRRRWWPIGLTLGIAVLLLIGWWWLNARRDQISDLRSHLAHLALVGPIPTTAAADLDRLAALAGADDPLVVEGRSRLQRVTALTTKLEALERRPDPDRSSVAAMRVGLAELTELVGIDGDPRLGRWRAWAEALEPHIERLRQRLAERLRGQEWYSAALRNEVADELEAFLRLARDDDPDRRAWQALVQRTDERITADVRLLERLDEPAPLSATEVESLRRTLEVLVPLAPHLPALARWRTRLGSDEAELAAHRSVLERLDSEMLDANARTEVRHALEQLNARAALAPEEERRWRTRLDAATQELAALRARLAVLDGPRSVPESTGVLLERYEALAGFDDAQAVTWRQRYEAIRTLLHRLATLDRAAPLPEQAAENLQQLAELVGSDDPQVINWRRKLAAVSLLRERLSATLDVPGELPTDLDTSLTEWAALLGDTDPDLRRWTARRDEQRALAATMDAWEQLVVLPADAVAQARAALARYLVLAMTDERSSRANRRLAELLPPPPVWATATGHDHHGPWADLHHQGANQRLRWLPPLTFTLGSPNEEPGHEADETPVRVRLSRGLWVADRECTQAMWAAVMGTQPARRLHPELPVESISAPEAEAWCARLATVIPGCLARLPTEAEWEGAMRAGADGAWGAIEAAQVEVAIVHRVPGIRGPRVSGSGLANPIGLYDGPGNLWEWCTGAYGPPPAGALVVDPLPPPGTPRVARGGSWGDPLSACRLANRTALAEEVRSVYLGFRFVVDSAALETRP